MKKQKKPFHKRLLSLLLFLVITWLVFNFEYLLHRASIHLGFSQMNWEEINKIDLRLDNTLNHRPVIMAHESHVVVSFLNEISIFDDQGNFLAKREVNSDYSRIIGLNNHFVVADMMQGHIFVLDYLGNTTGTIYSIGPIKDIIKAPDNMFVIITQAGELMVYDYEGILVSIIAMPPGHLIGLDLSKDQSTLLLNVLDSDLDYFKTKLLFYDMNKHSLVGGHNNRDRVVYGAKLINNQIIIINDQGQLSFERGQEESYLWKEERNASLKHFEIDTNGNIFELIAVDEVEYFTGLEEYRLIGRNKDGKLLFDIKLDGAYESMQLHNGEILLQKSDQILILTSQGQEIKRFDSKKKILSCQWLSQNRIMIEYNDYISIMVLKY